METSFFPQAVMGPLPLTVQPIMTAAAHTTNDIRFILISPSRTRCFRMTRRVAEKFHAGAVRKIPVPVRRGTDAT
jgi:hypothetical protein